MFLFYRKIMVTYFALLHLIIGIMLKFCLSLLVIKLFSAKHVRKHIDFAC